MTRPANHRRLTAKSSPFGRAGFTLLEMILVVAIMAVFASMALPSILRMFNQQKVTVSAERVREAIANARVRAIETGLVYQFCFEPNGSHYVVVPFEPDHAVAHNNSGSGGVPTAGRGAGSLPKGIVFSASQSGMASNSVAGFGILHLAPEALDGLPNSGELAGLSWATPILFKPDGSASADTAISVSDSRSQTIHLHVRAFTGAVSMERLVVGKH